MDMQNKEHEGQSAVSGTATLPVLRGKKVTYSAIT